MQISIAFLLFGTLHGIDVALSIALEKQRADFLYINPAVRGDSLPTAYAARIARVDGVELVNPQNFLVGNYQDEEQVVGVASNPVAYFQMNDYLKASSESLASMKRSQSAAIIGRVLATKFGWHDGDRVSLRTGIQRRDGSFDWEFEIVGVYDYEDEPDMANLLIFDNRYLDNARADEGIARVARFTAKVADASVVPRAVVEIDTLFTNSSHATETTAESENARARLAALGNIGFLTRAISASALVALLLSVGALGINSIRARTSEFGVMRALGFARTQIAALIFGEWCVKFILGAAAGLTVSWALIPYSRVYIGLVEMPIQVMIAGICWAMVLAIACTWLPARFAMRSNPSAVLAKE